MMKSFFKKLAFVMALAMVVSMAAPAGSVFAATTGIAIQDTKDIRTEFKTIIPNRIRILQKALKALCFGGFFMSAFL